MKYPEKKPKAAILYVDDDVENLESFKAVFRRNYTIHLANSAQEAIRTLETTTVQVLITDQRMPETSGSDFLKMVADRYPDMLRFMLTGFSDFDPLMDAINQGKLQGCFSKPLDIQRLTDHIEKGLSSYYLKMKNEALNKALKKSEARLRSLFDQAAVGIAALEHDGRFKIVNRKLCDILGFKEEMLLKKPLHAVVHHVDIQPDSQRLKELLESKKSIFNIESKCRCHTEECLWCSITLSNVSMSDGKSESLIAIVQDITDQKRAEKEKRDLTTQLHQTQKLEAIGTLSSGIAHDFKNILSPIIGFAQLIIDTTPNESEINDQSRQILKAGIRANELVTQVLTFSREKAGQKKTIRVEPIVIEALKLLRASLPSTTVLTQSISDTGSPIMGDPTQIYQVIVNLCTNAFQAMPDQGGKIDVVVQKVVLTEDQTKLFMNISPGAFMMISISDTGVGIEPAIVGRIFEPYFSTKRRKDGTGLGLSVVHGIIKGHGGEINVSSEVGTGTTFTVYLPSIEDLKTPQTKGRVQLVPRGSERILLVDDEKSLVNVISQILKSLGYRVTGFSDSRKALAHYMEHPHSFDLVISDMTMPHITGTDLAREIHSKTPDLPIIICTGYSENLNQKAAEKLGIRRIIMKPIVKKEIAAFVREVLDLEHKK